MEKVCSALYFSIANAMSLKWFGYGRLYYSGVNIDPNGVIRSILAIFPPESTNMKIDSQVWRWGRDFGELKLPSVHTTQSQVKSAHYCS